MIADIGLREIEKNTHKKKESSISQLCISFQGHTFNFYTPFILQLMFIHSVAIIVHSDIIHSAIIMMLIIFITLQNVAIITHSGIIMMLIFIHQSSVFDHYS